MLQLHCFWGFQLKSGTPAFDDAHNMDASMRGCGYPLPFCIHV